MDYIAIMETINNRECKNLEIIKTRKFDNNSDKDTTGTNVKPALFDYVWYVNEGAEICKYRIVNPMGHKGMSVYPMNLNVSL